jgi:hypothetical protein
MTRIKVLRDALRALYAAMRYVLGSHARDRYEAAAVVVPCPGEAPPVVSYGRPQHIPETVKARLRGERDKVALVEEIDEAGRP